MLMTLGRFLSPVSSGGATRAFDLTAALPPDVTYARNDGVATTRNASGKLVVLSANAPRFDHDESANPLGLLVEGTRQNKCALYNAAPTTTTGLTVASGSPTLSIVSDPTALAAAGLDQIGNGNVFRIEAGASDCDVDLAGATGNVNPHSFSVYARLVGGSTARLRRTGTGSGSTIISGGAYARYRLENETPSGTTNQLRLQVNAGGTLYALLPQMEEGAFCSSPIVTAGAAATRAADEVRLLNPGGKFWFSEQQGYAAVRYRPLALGLPVDQYVFALHAGNTNETIGLRINKTDRDLQGWFKAGGVAIHSLSTDVAHLPGLLQGAGAMWKPGEGTILQQSGYKPQTYAANPAGLVEMDFGHRNGATDPLWGHVERVEIGNHALSAGALSARVRARPGDVSVVTGGQSLAFGYFESQQSGGHGGFDGFLSTMGGLLRPRNVCTFVNGATGGTAASKTSDAALYWWDLATSTRGPAFDTFYNNLSTCGLSPGVVYWVQGEADAHQIGLATTRQQYKDALEAIFADMRARFAGLQIVVQRLGRRTSFANTGGSQAVREVQQELIDAYSWCHEGPESYDQPLFDSVHPNDAAYAVMGPRAARAVAAALGDSVPSALGPRITEASRTGTNVTVTVAHDSGTDLSPSGGIEGFSFFDGTTPVSITSAVRTNATTLTLTLASTPTGVQTLYYGYDAMVGLNTANVIRDNSPYALPLRTRKIVL
jgi:lysophospholipase L1-like esterase